MITDNIRRLYTIARAEAERAVGGRQAFRFLGPDLRRAVVSQQVLNLVYCQDDTISGDTLRAVIDGLVGRIVDDPDFQ